MPTLNRALADLMKRGLITAEKMAVVAGAIAFALDLRL
jgi:predicted transcriptional regulator